MVNQKELERTYRNKWEGQKFSAWVVIIIILIFAPVLLIFGYDYWTPGKKAIALILMGLFLYVKGYCELKEAKEKLAEFNQNGNESNKKKKKKS